MGVKRLVRAFVALTLVVLAGTTAYYHYVEGKTPSSAVFQAMQRYNGAMNAVVTAVLDAVARYRNAS
ncbi:MAG: hypothetical protein ABEJ44_03215 [Halanaeroarchaeum sp.]